jgi:hypothetical protein
MENNINENVTAPAVNKPFKKFIKAIVFLLKLVYVALPVFLVFIKGIPGLAAFCMLFLVRQSYFFVELEGTILAITNILGFIAGYYAAKFSWALMTKGRTTRLKHKVIFFVGLVFGLVGWVAGIGVSQIGIS